MRAVGFLLICKKSKVLVLEFAAFHACPGRGTGERRPPDGSEPAAAEAVGQETEGTHSAAGLTYPLSWRVISWFGDWAPGWRRGRAQRGGAGGPPAWQRGEGWARSGTGTVALSDSGPKFRSRSRRTLRTRPNLTSHCYVPSHLFLTL